MKKSSKSSANTSYAVQLMLQGATKRRRVAMLAVKTLNQGLGFEPNLRVVK